MSKTPKDLDPKVAHDYSTPKQGSLSKDNAKIVVSPADHNLDPLDPQHDAVFGNLEGGVNYRGLSFWGAVVVLMKTQIGVGVLSFPFTLQVLGLVPEILCFLAIAGMTTWSDIYIGHFKLKHPELYAIDDMGATQWGRIGRIVYSTAYFIYVLIASGLGISAISTAFNGISAHAICTAAFVAIAGILTCAGASIQTLSRLSWLSAVGCASVVVSVFILVIAAGAQARPAAAPQMGPWDKDLKLFNNPTAAEAGAALWSIVYTVCGTSQFFPVISEMRDPRQYFKAVYVCQGIIISINVIVGIVVYYYCGQYVTSPAPGSAGPLLKRVVYGVGFIGVAMGAVVCLHMIAKFLFVRWLRGSRHLTAHTWQHWACWMTCTISCGIVAYLIAAAIPVFSILVALGGSFLGPFVSMHPYGLFWFHDYWLPRGERTTKWYIGASWAVWMIVGAVFIQVMGTYGSITGVVKSFGSDHSAPFTCADNSGTVA